jgi:hypothetical protein
MVAGVSAGGHVGVVSMTALRYAQADAGDVIMPVRPTQAVYANFKHIQVRPDSRLDEGVPLYKLKILDTLIDHLSAKRPPAAVDAGSIDTTIIEMSRSMRTAGGGFGTAGGGFGAAGGGFGATAGGPGASYRAGFLPPPGAFVDLVA